MNSQIWISNSGKGGKLSPWEGGRAKRRNISTTDAGGNVEEHAEELITWGGLSQTLYLLFPWKSVRWIITNSANKEEKIL